VLNCFYNTPAASLDKKKNDFPSVDVTKYVVAKIKMSADAMTPHDWGETTDTFAVSWLRFFSAFD
jgi:hypothetical protein